MGDRKNKKSKPVTAVSKEVVKHRRMLLRKMQENVSDWLLLNIKEKKDLRFAGFLGLKKNKKEQP